MMERYFYDNCGSQEAYEALKQDPVFPLIRDLNFQYKLKVLKTFGTHGAYQLVNHLGLAVCAVRTVNDGGKEGNKLEYIYRSPYYSKQRGSSVDEKQSIRSIKVSSLMATLKRQGVVPNDLTKRKSKIVDDAITQVRRAIGSSTKMHDLSPDEVHALLANYLGGNPDRKFAPLDSNKCKMALDKMNECDDTRRFKMQEVKRFFCDGYYQFGVDGFGHLIVGKFKVDHSVIDHSLNVSVDCIEPFKRYVNPNDCEELQPLMTMIKVAYENPTPDQVHFSSKTALNTPVADGYDKSLDVVFYRQATVTNYDCQWMFTPIGAMQ